MNKKTFMFIGALVVLLIVGMFAYAQYAKQRIADTTDDVPPPAEEEFEEVRINGVHVYQDGSHTIIGELLMPTACHLIDADIVIRESMPEQVTVALMTIAPSPDVMCAQVVTNQRFRVDFDASEEAVIEATLDGRPAILNLVEGDPSTDLDIDSEFYFKG